MQSSLVNAWRRFEALLAGRGLGWMLSYAPADLAIPSLREFDLQSALALLPDDYRAFVDEVGYPMLGSTRFCNVAWSCLPPACIAAHGKLCPPGDEPRDVAIAAFFAAYFDVGDMWGYAFARSDDELVVWRCVEGGALDRPCGTFTAWMTSELARLSTWVEALSANEIATLSAGAESAQDPHHLLFAAREVL